MRKKIVFIIILLFCLCLSTRINANSSANFSVETNKQRLNIKEELIVSIKSGSNTDFFNVYKATLNYDKSIFEEIDESSFICENSWSNLKYNKENGQFILISEEDNIGEIAKIHFKVKDNSKLGDTIISLNNITTSYGEGDISLEPIDLNISIYEEKNNDNEDNTQDNDSKPSQDKDDVEEKPKNDEEDKNEVIDTPKPNTNATQKPIQNVSNERLPQTGKSTVILYVILIFVVIAMVCFIRYKKINKKIMMILVIALSVFSNTDNIKTYAYDIENILSNITVTPDINKDGRVDDIDVNDLEEMLIGLKSISNESDINSDNKVNVTDLSLLLKYLTNKDREITVSDTSFTGFKFEQITPENKKVTYERVLMKTKQQREYGINGAGSQWPVSLESSNDGSLMLYGIDVAGMYKSTDHGKTWSIANCGIESRGVGMFAIDPYNTNHVLTLGLGSGGIHISYDKAETWKKTYSQKIYGERYLWDGLEFDPTTYDSEKKLTMDVYYSTPYMRDTNIRNTPTTQPKSHTSLTEEQVGLYKSTDGGETFSLIINDKKLADGIIKATDNGKIYVGNQYGLFLIDKENNTIKKAYLENDPSIDYSKGITGLDVVGNTIYAQTWEGIYTLIDDNLTLITNEEYKSENWPQFLEVSKSNPNHMIYQYRSDTTNYYVNNTVVTFDGGKTWEYAKIDLNTTFYKSSWAGREKLYIIDPSNDNNVITFGSDTLMRSEDGGLNFVQVSGISNMMQGGKFNFNYYDPNLLLFSAQDYTGLISTDGGETYTRLNIPGKGNFYGGFAADKDTIFGFANPSWGGGTLTYTHDGGDTWIDTGLKATGVPECRHYSSLQSPTNPNVLFAVEYYSKDKGYTWNKMNGCTSVFTYNYTGKKELYGGNADGKVVVSYDNGDTWKIVCNKSWNESSSLIKQTILDLAYDHVNNYIYAVVQLIIKGEGDAKYTAEVIYKLNIDTGEFKKLNIPVDTVRGYMRQNSIAIDPNATSVIYVGGNGGYFSSATALLRSIDGGETWKILTSNNTEKYPSFNNNQGGYEVTNVRVNPYDGRVWISCGCYGYETFDPPYDSSLLTHEKPKEHTIKYVYGNKVVNELTIKNNEKPNYIYEEDRLTFVDWYTDKELTIKFPKEARIYNSMVLYAKMRTSERIKFYDGDNLLKEIDLDEYKFCDNLQRPTRDGYVFAGWYKDKELTQLVDFEQLSQSCSVYAGWYKIVEDVFDINAEDMGNYIAFGDHRIQDGKNVPNNAKVDNRCIHMNIDKNSIYYISFKMDTRFRIGLGLNTFWQYNIVPSYYIDENDINGKKPANKYVFKTISSENYNKLLVHYYTETGSRDFMDIKNTFIICKIDGMTVYR